MLIRQYFPASSVFPGAVKGQWCPCNSGLVAEHTSGEIRGGQAQGRQISGGANKGLTDNRRQETRTNKHKTEMHEKGRERRDGDPTANNQGKPT